MKTVAKFATAALLALSAAAPALANPAGEEITLEERNTYLYTPDARPIVRNDLQVRTHRAGQALAQAPIGAPNAGVNNHGAWDGY